MNRKMAHKMWLINAKKRISERAQGDHELPICESCGCEGNCECGHVPLDKYVHCSLDGSMICGCCIVEPNKATDAEIDDLAGQARLF